MEKGKMEKWLLFSRKTQVSRLKIWFDLILILMYTCILILDTELRKWKDGLFVKGIDQ
jgi:hypothetical protein